MNTDNIKAAFKKLIGVVEDVVPLFADDGKLSRTELLGLLFIAPKIPSVIEDAKVALPAFKKLKPADAKDVAAFIREEFDLSNDKLEKQIEDGIDLLARGYEVGSEVYALVQDVENYITSFKAA
jgi:hypothetical protein